MQFCISRSLIFLYFILGYSFASAEVIASSSAVTWTLDGAEMQHGDSQKFILSYHPSAVHHVTASIVAGEAAGISLANNYSEPLLRSITPISCNSQGNVCQQFAITLSRRIEDNILIVNSTEASGSSWHQNISRPLCPFDVCMRVHSPAAGNISVHSCIQIIPEPIPILQSIEAQFSAPEEPIQAIKGERAVRDHLAQGMVSSPLVKLKAVVGRQVVISLSSSAIGDSDIEYSILESPGLFAGATVSQQCQPSKVEMYSGEGMVFGTGKNAIASNKTQCRPTCASHLFTVAWTPTILDQDRTHMVCLAASLPRVLTGARDPRIHYDDRIRATSTSISGPPICVSVTVSDVSVNFVSNDTASIRSLESTPFASSSAIKQAEEMSLAAEQTAWNLVASVFDESSVDHSNKALHTTVVVAPGCVRTFSVSAESDIPGIEIFTSTSFQSNHLSPVGAATDHKGIAHGGSRLVWQGSLNETVASASVHVFFDHEQPTGAFPMCFFAAIQQEVAESSLALNGRGSRMLCVTFVVAPCVRCGFESIEQAVQTIGLPLASAGMLRSLNSPSHAQRFPRNATSISRFGLKVQPASAEKSSWMVREELFFGKLPGGLYKWALLNSPQSLQLHDVIRIGMLVEPRTPSSNENASGSGSTLSLLPGVAQEFGTTFNALQILNPWLASLSQSELNGREWTEPLCVGLNVQSKS